MKFNLEKSNSEWKLSFEIPITVKRNNPYAEEDCGLMDNIIGLIDKDKFGLAKTIDMSYKGKADQYTDFFLDLSFFMDEKEFEQLCEKNKISIIKL